MTVEFLSPRHLTLFHPERPLIAAAHPHASASTLGRARPVQAKHIHPFEREQSAHEAGMSVWKVAWLEAQSHHPTGHDRAGAPDRLPLTEVLVLQTAGVWWTKSAAAEERPN